METILEMTTVKRIKVQPGVSTDDDYLADHLNPVTGVAWKIIAVTESGGIYTYHLIRYE